MAGLLQREFAELAGVSQQAVGKATRVGYLRRDVDGRLDPRDRDNAAWLKLHREGSDVRGRELNSHVGRGGTRFRAAPGDVAMGPQFDDAQLERIVHKVLVALEAPLSADDSLMILLNRILSEIEGLRQALGRSR